MAVAMKAIYTPAQITKALQDAKGFDYANELKKIDPVEPRALSQLTEFVNTIFVKAQEVTHQGKLSYKHAYALPNNDCSALEDFNRRRPKEEVYNKALSVLGIKSEFDFSNQEEEIYCKFSWNKNHPVLNPKAPGVFYSTSDLKRKIQKKGAEHPALIKILDEPANLTALTTAVNAFFTRASRQSESGNLVYFETLDKADEASLQHVLTACFHISCELHFHIKWSGKLNFKSSYSASEMKNIIEQKFTYAEVLKKLGGENDETLRATTTFINDLLGKIHQEDGAKNREYLFKIPAPENGASWNIEKGKMLVKILASCFDVTCSLKWRYAWEADHSVLHPKPLAVVIPYYTHDQVKQILLSSQGVTKRIEEDSILAPIVEFIDSLIGKNFNYANLIKNLDGESALKALTEFINAVLTKAAQEAKQGRLDFSVDSVNRPDPLKHLNRSSVLTTEEIAYTEALACFGVKRTYTVLDRGIVKWHYSWPSNHPIIKPKPTYRAPDPAIRRKDYYGSYVDNDKHADLVFKVNGKLFHVHKFMLSKCEKLEKMFPVAVKALNEQEIVEFPDCDQSTFLALLKYIYTEEFPAKECVKMFKLAHRLDFEALKEVAKEHIFAHLPLEECLDLALLNRTIGDVEVNELCKWFLRSDPEIHLKLNLAALSYLNAIYAAQIAQSFHCLALLEAAMDKFKQKLCLDQDFIPLCDFIKAQKDKDLKVALMSAITNNQTLAQELKSPTNKKYYDVYTILITNLEF